MSAGHAAFSRIATLFVVLTLGVAQADPGPKTVGPLDVAPEQGGASDVEIAFEHAPVHYQDTDSTFSWADYITKFDFDVNWQADDNWDNLMKHPLLARVYFSVVETCTRWLVVYGFFHPRDWTDEYFDGDHENDLEGFLAVVRKPGPSGPRLGQLEAVVPSVHTHFYSYVPKGSSFRSGAETIDGELEFIEYAGSRRPKTSQQAKGHPLKAWPLYFNGLDARDGIIYYPSKHDSDVPCSGRGLILAYLFVQTLIDSMDPDYGSGSNIGGLGLVFILGVAVIGLGIVIMIVQAIRRPAFFRGETLSLDAPPSVRPKR